MILARIESRQNDVLECRPPTEIVQINAQTVLKVLIEVARSLRSVSWTDGLNRMTLNELLRRCYTSIVLPQPGEEDVTLYWQHFLLLMACLTALDFEHTFPRLKDPLSSSFFFKFRAEPIYEVMKMVLTHRRMSRGINAFKQLRLPESSKETFFPDQFDVRYLQDFGGLKIEWTDSLEEHLKIYTDRNTSRVFAHPTYFDNFVDLNW